MAKTKSKNQGDEGLIRSIKFQERPGGIHHNASEVVCLADSRFLFCDNNISDSLFEIQFTPDGEMAGPLIPHAIRGVRPEVIDDLECMTMAEVDGTHILFVSSSLGLKTRKGAKGAESSRKGKVSTARESLIRMKIGSNACPEAEIIPGFRYWLVENAPVLGKSPGLAPDHGGLNIEGLAWDPVQQVLLFGLRTPMLEGKPLILRVRIKDPNGIWNLSGFEMLSPISLAIAGADGRQGIRCIQYDTSRRTFLVIVGNAVSGCKTPFHLYSWDGNVAGTVTQFNQVSFHKKMKPEGITHGTIGGRGAVLFVDDAGGYQFLWDDDPRLQQTADD